MTIFTRVTGESAIIYNGETTPINNENQQDNVTNQIGLETLRETCTISPRNKGRLRQIVVISTAALISGVSFYGSYRATNSDSLGSAQIPLQIATIVVGFIPPTILMIAYMKAKVPGVAEYMDQQ